MPDDAVLCLDCYYVSPFVEKCLACGSKRLEPVDLDEEEGEE